MNLLRILVNLVTYPKRLHDAREMRNMLIRVIGEFIMEREAQITAFDVKVRCGLTDTTFSLVGGDDATLHLFSAATEILTQQGRSPF